MKEKNAIKIAQYSTRRSFNIQLVYAVIVDIGYCKHDSAK